MNFRKISERGEGGVISDPKNFIAIFFALEKAILVMNFRKKLRKGGGHFQSEKFRCKFSAGATSLQKNCNIFFPKRGGGQRPFGNFSKNSSIFETTGIPKQYIYIIKFLLWYHSRCTVFDHYLKYTPYYTL